MDKNNTVYLLVGTRGAGKSHYAQKIVENQTAFSIVSRDEILIRLFGSTHTDPYSGAQYIAMMVMDRLLRRKLNTQQNLRLILDCWAGERRERKSLMKMLRQYGASRVVALYFVTPIEFVQEWFWKKPGIAKSGERRAPGGEDVVYYSESAPDHDSKLFHKLAKKIDTDGFDEVIRVNPVQELITLL